MGLNLGSIEISDLRLGSTQVSKLYLGSTESWDSDPTPVPDYALVYIYNYYKTANSIKKVRGGRAVITDDDIFVSVFTMGQPEEPPATPISVEIVGDNIEEPWAWQVTAVDANGQEMWIGGDSLTMCMSITPNTTPFDITFNVNSLAEMHIDTTTVNTRTIEDMTEFDTLSNPDRDYDATVLDGVPIEAIKKVITGPLVTSFPDYFLSTCDSLTVVDISNSTNVTSIPDYFLVDCRNLNCPISIPSSVTSIGRTFLGGCEAFNCPITIPSGVTVINTEFLSGCEAFNSTLTLPSVLYSIDDGFLAGCYEFNQPLTLPSSITSIGANFLGDSVKFNQPVTLPSSLTSLGQYAFRNVYAMVSPIDVGSLSPTICDFVPVGGAIPSDYYFSMQSNTAPAYTQGIPIKGSNREAWLTTFGDLSFSNFYRKLLDGGA